MNKELPDEINTETRLIDYYARRAPEYEQIYHRPERQQDLRKLEQLVTQAFCGLDVLEIACGTGYWTQFIAKQARSVLATDCNREVIDIAREKNYARCAVSFVDYALVLLIDNNRYVEGNSLPISRHDAEGNTYQKRRLADGSEHEVLKNFPTKAGLVEQLTPYAHDIEIELLTYYWLATYRVTKR
jgi:demethylmenaquinone methyltransferase/2-methoxy-6-polyprenyl-1,4-benzoquinol methylase